MMMGHKTNKRRVALVTGGAGFIGAHLVNHLAEQGAHVIVLDDMSVGNAERPNPAAQYIVGSVLDGPLVRTLVGRSDEIYHLAAVASIARSNEDYVGSHRVNLTGFLTVLDAVRQSQRPHNLIYASSAAVYGQAKHFPIDEEQDKVPLSPFGADKLSCELHARAAFESFQVPSVGLRLFNVYGPRQKSVATNTGVISKFAEHLLTDLPLPIYGSGAQSRDFVFVTDVARVMARFGSAPNSGQSVFNVCTGVETSIANLAQIMGRLTKRNPIIEHQDPRAGDIGHSVGNPARLMRNLNINQWTSVEEGLRAYLDYIRFSENTAPPEH